MKIFRGPRTTGRWHLTDSKTLTKWAKDWYPGKTLMFDATIEKGGERHTDLGVEIKPQDIVALHNGLMRYQTDRIRDLEKEYAKLEATVSLLEEALGKIETLVSVYADEAPSIYDLLAAVEKIAEHFRWSFNRDKQINLGWIKWKTL